VKQSVTRFLQRNLKLAVNEQKSRIVPTDQMAFLGFTFRGAKVRWTEKALEAFKREIRQLTGRSWGVSMDYRMKKLKEYIRGWMGYFGISEYYRPIPALDEWLRRRVRMCYWKQWRKPRARIRNLIQLGAFERTAIQTGLSRKSYWRLSRTLATQSGMTNDWLKEQGLISIRELWIAMHYPATAR
jgi:RNA-directed DNA polymerase